MALTFALLGLVLSLTLRVLYRRFTRISVAHVPGPGSGSFVFGEIHLLKLPLLTLTGF